jgi:hypothetical protein
MFSSTQFISMYGTDTFRGLINHCIAWNNIKCNIHNRILYGDSNECFIELNSKKHKVLRLQINDALNFENGVNFSLTIYNHVNIDDFFLTRPTYTSLQ